jgi:hypothetical protein
MKSAFAVGLLSFACLIVCVVPATAANPNDLDFKVRFTRAPAVYHIGERIEFELSYSSETEHKYLTSASNPMPEFGGVKLHLVPVEGIIDPRSLRPCWGGFGGSFLSSGPQYLSVQPITSHADLTNWFHFQKSGHYSLTVTSSAVSRPKTAEEGGGQETVTLESDTIEFDILPHDPVWESEELHGILLALENTKYPGDQYIAAHRLALLDMPDSARKLVEFYLSTSPSSPEQSNYVIGLTQSSQLDVIVPILESALSDPGVTPPGTELLAQLQVRKQLGQANAPADDPAAQQRSQAECQDRRKLHDEYLARANDLLLKRISRDSGPHQAAAILEAWQNAEAQKTQTGRPPANMTQLRLAVLSIAGQLTPDQKSQFVFSEWNTLPRDVPHEQLLPLIRELASANRPDVYRLWCEGWPGECSAAILSEALKPDAQIGSAIVLLMSEAEHSEVDQALREQLANPAMLQDSLRSDQIAALVLRAGSRELLPAVLDLLARSASNRGYNCQVQGFLAGYLFKVEAEGAQQRLTAMLQDQKCGEQFLHTLNTACYSDSLIPVAVKALDSSNLTVASQAAIFLGQHGSGAVQDTLWQRLNALWTLWHDHAEELRGPSLPLDKSIQSQSAHLEQSLASALAHGNNWKLTPAERDRLRDGCLTEQCQRIAEGKMSFGL